MTFKIDYCLYNVLELIQKKNHIKDCVFCQVVFVKTYLELHYTVVYIIHRIQNVKI